MAWDITTAAYASTKDISAQDTTPFGLAFSPDGTKMFVVGYGTDSVYRYDLSTAWDITSATYVSAKDVSAQDTTPLGLAFSGDGTKMFVMGNTTDSVYRYDLTTGWDVTTATYVSAKDASAQDTTLYSVAFSPDGTKMFVLGNGNKSVYRYDLTTAWDITSATYVSLKSVSAQDTSPYGVAFSGDGTKMFVLGYANSSVYRYDLADAGGTSVTGTAAASSASDAEVTAGSLTVAGVPASATSSSTLAPVFTNAVGSASFSVEGSGVVSINADPYDPPTITTPTPGGSAAAPAVPAFVVPAEAIQDPVIRHVAETMPAPTVVDGWPENWVPTSVIDVEYGRLQITVEGVDITWINGIKTPFPSWSDVEPFGFQAASIEIPQLTIFHAVPAWATKNANVEIRLLKEAGGYTQTFVGTLFDAAISEDTGVFSLECIGIMFASDYTLRPPSFTTAPKDIGALIPEVLNGAVSRRYETVANVTTGIKSSVAGGWETRLTGYVQQLLATALSDGKQWTVTCANRTPVLAKKDTTTIAWEIWAGQRGIEVNLHSDTADQTNVVFAEGVSKDGGRWRNAKYPNWKPDDTPQYPFTSPAKMIFVGMHDSDTDTGNGISRLEAKLGIAVNGYYSLADKAEVKRAQSRAGVTVDGILGPQTWNAVFDTGANTGSLDGSFIAPIAAAMEVIPRIYGPGGDELGANPLYDQDIARIERKIDFGQGVGLIEGRRAAEEIVARDSKDGWYGTVSFTEDPSTKSRYELRAGENGIIHGWRGADVVVHTASADITEGTVSLQVDTKARDYPTLEAIRETERSATDPALAAIRRLLKGNISSDRAVYDAESPAGRMPRHTLNGGFWDVRRIPMGSFGSVSRTDFKTTSSASAFTMAVFGKSVTAAQILAVAGNPLTTATQDPWSVAGDALDDMGLLQAWGWKEQPAGYYPRTKTNPSGESGAPITGRLLDDSSWAYASQSSPWLWVAMLSSSDCYIEGRFYGQEGE